MLAPPQHSALAAWSTGWFNLLGQVGSIALPLVGAPADPPRLQVAVTTGISYGLAGLITTLASLHGFESSAPKQIGIYAAILISHGLVNSAGIKVLAIFNRVSIVLQSVGVMSLAIALLAKAPTHRSAREVFAHFYDGTGDPGWSVRASPAYVACIGV